MRKLLTAFLLLVSAARAAEISYPTKTFEGTWKTTDYTEWQILQTNTVDALNITNTFALDSGLVNKLLIRGEADAGFLSKTVTIAVYSGGAVDEKKLLIREEALLESLPIYTNIAAGTNDISFVPLDATTNGTLVYLRDGADNEYARLQSQTIAPGVWDTSWYTVGANAYNALTYNGHLYVTTSDSGLQQIRRWDGSTWQGVYQNSNPAFSFAFRLETHDGRLFATAGKQVVSTDDGTTWVTNFNAGGVSYIWDLYSDGTTLYVGEQQSGATALTIVEYDGVSWVTNISGTIRQSGGIRRYNGTLFFGNRTTGTGGDIYFWDGASVVLTNDVPYQQSLCSAEYDGKLYFGHGDSTGNGEISVLDGTWSTSFSTAYYALVWALIPHDGYLYAGMGQFSGMGDILRFDGNTWTVVYDGSGSSARVYQGGLGAIYAHDYQSPFNLFRYVSSSSTPIYLNTKNAYTTAGKIGSVYEYVPMGVMPTNVTVKITVASTDQTFDIITDWRGLE